MNDIDAYIRIKTPVVLEMLSCDKATLRKWRIKCPKLFAPVLCQRNGNIYRKQQVKIMIDVMDGLKTPEAGAELWERTMKVNDDVMYRDAGDTSRGARK